MLPFSWHIGSIASRSKETIERAGEYKLLLCFDDMNGPQAGSASE